jgi:hypothetical protein
MNRTFFQALLCAYEPTATTIAMGHLASATGTMNWHPEPMAHDANIVVSVLAFYFILLYVYKRQGVITVACE